MFHPTLAVTEILKLGWMFSFNGVTYLSVDNSSGQFVPRILKLFDIWTSFFRGSIPFSSVPLLHL